MSDSVIRRLDRASNKIDELNGLIREKRPFRYIFETDTFNGERSIGTKRDKYTIEEAV